MGLVLVIGVAAMFVVVVRAVERAETLSRNQADTAAALPSLAVIIAPPLRQHQINKPRRKPNRIAVDHRNQRNPNDNRRDQYHKIEARF